MKALIRYITNMDARAVRAVAVSVGLVLTVAFILVLGRTQAFFDDDDAPFIQWMQERADSPWALPATIALFTVAAFFGAPQFVLIAAAVVALGPSRGFFYSWIATMVSASVDFGIGRTFGADVLRRYGGGAANRVSAFVGRNGFMTALLVRIVPSAPFIVVNLAAGVSHMSYLAFASGTGLGIIPKTALVAFASGGVIALWTGKDWRALVFILAAAAAWIAVMLAARAALRRRDAEKALKNTPVD